MVATLAESTGAGSTAGESRRTGPDAVENFLLRPDEESFRDLFRALAPQVAAYFRSRGCDLQLSEDLTQEVMLTVYRQSADLRSRGAFRPWLFKVMKNSLLQHVRRSVREIPTVALSPAHAEAGGPMPDPLAGTRFHQWMSALEPHEQEILSLRYVSELEYHEIAEILEMPIGTVQWKVFNAKKKLAVRFGKSMRVSMKV